MHRQLSQQVLQFQVAKKKQRIQIVEYVEMLAAAVYTKASSFAADKGAKIDAEFFDLAASDLLEREFELKSAIMRGKEKGQRFALELDNKYATIIQRKWRSVVADPNTVVCQKRLRREFQDMNKV